MDEKKLSNEIAIILFSAIILSISVSFWQTELFLKALVSFTAILFFVALVKNIFGYYKELDTETTFLTWKRFGKKKHQHWKKGIPLFLISLLLAPFNFFWLGILETKVTARTERVAKRQRKANRFSQVTEWHEALVALAGIITLLVLITIGKMVGSSQFSMWGIDYLLWSIIPISRLDGAKIFFGSKNLWFATTIGIIIYLLIFFSL